MRQRGPATRAASGHGGQARTNDAGLGQTGQSRLAHEEGRAVVCVTHDREVAAAADRRVHMLDGRIERED